MVQAVKRLVWENESWSSASQHPHKKLQGYTYLLVLWRQRQELSWSSVATGSSRFSERICQNPKCRQGGGGARL